MANNCLVTKLKGSVDNNNLPKLNTLVLVPDVAEGEYSTFEVAIVNAQKPITISVTRGNSHLKQGGTGYDDATDLGQSTEFSNASNRLIYVTPGADTIVEIQSIYDVKSISLNLTSNPATHDMMLNNNETIKSMLGLESIAVKKYVGSVSSVVNLLKDLPSFKNLSFAISETGISGRLSDFLPLADKLEVLTIAACTNISGDIAELGTMIHLNKFVFYSNANIYGTIEEFVQAQRAAGRTTNSTGIDFTWLHSTSVKFDGEFVELGNTPTITWTENTITLSNAQSYTKTVNA